MQNQATPRILLSVLSLLLASAPAQSRETPANPELARACTILLSPHQTFAGLLPELSDSDALQIVKANYRELFDWLRQKADHTAEGGTTKPTGDYGVEKNQTPSELLFGENITEVNRTLVGFLALKWILSGDYERFTQNQPEKIRLSRPSFDRLQTLVKSVLKTPEDVDAMVVIILLNDLGKVKRYHELMNQASSRVVVDHDEVFYVGAREWPEISPSFNRLSAIHKEWIIDGLKMGSSLNIGQFAQAENLPANLASMLTLDGKPDAFEFKFVELLLDVAGARGHQVSNGSAVLIEPVFKSFELARTALLQVVAGKSLREAYDEILVHRAGLLADAGFKRLSPVNATDRALLRLLTLSRATDVVTANRVTQAFESLPSNAKAVLVSELNVDGVTDGFGTLLYYAPATITNAVNSFTEEPAKQAAVTEVLLAFARTLQESRIAIAGFKDKKGSGVITVDVATIAKFVQSDDFKKDPHTLSSQSISLVEAGTDGRSYFIKLAPLASVDTSRFKNLGALTNLPGQNVALVGIGGGSDGVQAAMLGHLLTQSGKTVKGVLSFRTPRTYAGSIPVADGVSRITTSTTGSGRVLEPIIANDFPTYLVIDPAIDDENSRQIDGHILAALKELGPLDTVILIDTGGDALYGSGGQETAKATPDQDLRVLNGFHRVSNQLTQTQFISGVIAVGVDSPPDAEAVLLRGKATYFLPSTEQIEQILAQYKLWQMDGSHSERYGKTPLAWHSALRGETGVITLPLPESVVLDRNNPWNPFSKVPTAGIFLMDVGDHIRAISKQ